ncbi:hypothetical protein ABW21_db0204442 [Orbilia brochopaga]|nr:hypothetical protein ABW21_db0204442 [Drechslerella brochopaga]
MGILSIVPLLLSLAAISANAAVTPNTNYHQGTKHMATREIQNDLHQTKFPRGLEDGGPYEEHLQFDADEFRYQDKYSKLKLIVDDGVTFFNDTKQYCTTWWKQDDVDDHGDYSQASVWCKEGYSVELWNKRNSTDEPAAQNVRVFCHDVLMIAQEALENVNNSTHPENSPPSPPDRYPKQQWLTSSVWTGDMNWGVGIVLLQDGCPDVADKVATATFSYEGKPADRSDRLMWEPSATPSASPTPGLNTTMPLRIRSPEYL